MPNLPSDENHYTPQFAVIPTFTLPRGYLSLWLTTSPGDCSSAGQLSWGKIPLISGKEIGVGGYSSDYDYCAVIDNSVGKVDGFTVNWSNGTPAIWRPAPYTLTTSTSSVTVSAGQTANYTITATSLNGWTGNLSLAPYASGPIGGRLGGPVNMTFVPSYVVVGPNGSNNTVLRVPTMRCSSLGTWCTPTGLYTIDIWAYWAQSCLASAPGGFCADGYNAANVSLQLNVA